MNDMTLPSHILDSDKKYIIGIDEVGLGCLAGPTYVCAVKAPKEWFYEGLRDSKKLTEKKREFYSDKLLHLAKEGIIQYAPAVATSFDIDREGIYHTIHRLYYEALSDLGSDDSLIVIDGKRFKEDRYEYTALVGGDDLIPHISAASILAKVARDKYMVDMDDIHPVYEWYKNKGYGTANHLKALKEHGPCPLHRRSYEPIKSMVK